MSCDSRTFAAASAALCCLLAVIGGGRARAERERFDGQRVLRIFPNTSADVKLLKDLEDSVFPQLDFWKAPSLPRRPVDVRVPQHILESFVEVLDSNNVAHSVMIENLQRAVDAELPPSRSRRSSSSLLSAYGTHDEINRWLDEAATQCGSRCSVITIGSTYEGRAMKVIRVSGSHRPSANTSSSSSSSSSKPAIWIDAGLHGREWIAPAMAISVINRIITDYATDACTKLLLDEFVWYVLPSANPDGYEFSRTQNRMWRKNRKPAPARSSRPPPPRSQYGRVAPAERGRSCNGTDLNRNFGHEWGGIGASSNPCADTYAGPQAFSEPETQSVSNFLLSLRPQLKVYLTLHSYGQYWLYPWAYALRRPDDDRTMSTIGIEASSATFEASGLRTFYNVGSAALTLYPAAGGSDDWAKAVAGAKYSFTVELSPSDREPLPSSGFLIPESDIPRIARETWPGVRAMARKVLEFERAANQGASGRPLSSIGDACPQR